MVLTWAFGVLGIFTAVGIVAQLSWDALVSGAIKSRSEKREKLGLPEASRFDDPQVRDQIRYHNGAI